MKLEIRYQTRLITPIGIQGFTKQRVLRVIGDTYSDADAALSKHFEEPIFGLSLTDGGVRFDYDPTQNILYSIATFFVESLPSQQQMQQLVAQITTQLDYGGYYGEDGWFIDLEGGFYLQLVDPRLRHRHPTSISLDGQAISP